MNERELGSPPSQLGVDGSGGGEGTDLRAALEAWELAAAGELREALARANEGLAGLGSSSRALPWLRLVLGYVAWCLNDGEGAALQLSAAFEEFSSAGDEAGMGRTLRLVGMAALDASDVETASAAIAESLRLLASSSDPDLGLALAAATAVAVELRDFEVAERLGELAAAGRTEEAVVLALARVG